MEFEYTTKSHLKLEVNPNGSGTSKVMESFVNFEAIPEIQLQWRSPDGLPNKDGFKAMTQGMIHGLLNNIHSCHQMGLWDSAEHLRYIIKYLESGFVKQVQVTKAEFPTSPSDGAQKQ